MCTSLDLIQQSMSDYVIHSTAGIIGEVDSMLSRTRAKGRPKDARRKQRAMARAGKAGAIDCCPAGVPATPYGILDNIESTSPIMPAVE